MMLAVLIPIGKQGIKIFSKNRLIIIFYAFVNTANVLELMGSSRHAALLFVHTLVIYKQNSPKSLKCYVLQYTQTHYMETRLLTVMLLTQMFLGLNIVFNISY